MAETGDKVAESNMDVEIDSKPPPTTYDDDEQDDNKTEQKKDINWEEEDIVLADKDNKTSKVEYYLRSDVQVENRIVEDAMDDTTHPYDHKNCLVRWFNKITHIWQFSLLKKGVSQPLEPEHIWDLPKMDSVDTIISQYDNLLSDSTENNESFSLFKLLYRQNKGLLWVVILNTLWSSALSLTLPYFIKYLSLFYEDTDQPIYYGIALAVGLLVSMMIRVLHNSFAWMTMSRLMYRIRNELMFIIYRKAINMSLYARNQSSTGQTVNLMSQDSNKVSMFFAFFAPFSSNFLILFVCLGLLFAEVGVAALAGFVFLVLTMPIQGKMGQKIGKTKRKMLQAADNRVKFINEILQGIRVVKLYAWELPLLKEVAKLRAEELKRLLLKTKYYAVLSGFNYVSPQLVALLTLGTYVLIGNDLQVSKTFTVIALINVMRFSIRILPWGAMLIIEGKVSTDRITKFLALPDLKRPPSGEDLETPIMMDNCSFTWVPLEIAENANGEVSPNDNNNNNNKNTAKVDNAAAPKANDKKNGDTIVSGNNSDDNNDDDDDEGPKPTKKNDKTKLKSATASAAENVKIDMAPGLAANKDPAMDGNKSVIPMTASAGPTLTNITFSLKKGSLTAVVGLVGSGKSSLLNSILGELDKLTGEIQVSGRISYTAQTPFVINATVRDNILFGLPYDRDRYKKCIKAAALLHDLRLLGKKDLTEIGERGINLSGGQKARISLARALYRAPSTDVFMFDDPLSAVDMEVGNHMFQQGICGVADGKTRILVMNSHLHLLRKVDNIIIMHKGTVHAMGNFKDLSADMEHNALLQSALEHAEASKEEVAAEDGLSKPNYHTSFSLMEESRDHIDDEKGKLIEEEDREHGSVKMGVYAVYLSNATGDFDITIPHATGPDTYDTTNWLKNTNFQGWCYLLTVLISMLFVQIFTTSSDLWLLFWAEEDEENRFPNESQWFWLGWWSALVGMLGILGFVTTYLFGVVAARAGKNLHMRVLYAVLRSPVSFFDATPVGRIINRFGKDTESMDDALPTSFTSLISNFLSIFGAIAVIAYTVPWILILLVLTGYFFYKIQKFFRASSRELQRIESVSRSPIYAQFSESLNGLDTIRAFNMQDHFINRNKSLVSTNGKLYYEYLMASRWLAMNLDLMVIFILFGVAIFGVFLRESISYGLLTLAVTYASTLTGVLQFTIRTIVDVENAATSVERLLHYQLNKPEAPEVIPSRAPPEDWPAKGEIKFDDLQMRYREELDLVLRGINATVKPGEKIGICGRTGAGKSSLLVALFRLVEPETQASIIIDGYDIQSMGLRDLRSNMSIIPQDPVLFSGSVRFNLDPFNERTDEQVWNALKKVHLYDVINEKEEKLNFVVAEAGSNFSQGQRQLICIGRALLRNSKVMLLDEATASVDSETDALIQTAIRDNFKDRTVLTIAHRLETILDSDRIMVLSDGQIVEFDKPANLLAIDNGVFKSMVNSGNLDKNDDNKQSAMSDEDDL